MSAFRVWSERAVSDPWMERYLLLLEAARLWGELRVGRRQVVCYARHIWYTPCTSQSSACKLYMPYAPMWHSHV